MTLLERRKYLLREKGEIDLKSAQIRIQIDAAKQSAAAYRKFTPIGILAGWKSQAASYAKQSQDIQRELSEIGGQIRRGEAKTLSEIFIDIARQSLSADEFDKLMRMALDRRNGEI